MKTGFPVNRFSKGTLDLNKMGYRCLDFKLLIRVTVSNRNFFKFQFSLENFEEKEEKAIFCTTLFRKLIFDEKWLKRMTRNVLYISKAIHIYKLLVSSCQHFLDDVKSRRRRFIT